MVNHRDQAKHDRAGWRLKVLVPIWMSQSSLLIILVGTASYLLSVAIKQSVEVRGTAVAWGAINIIAGALSILLTAYEIFKMATESLTPKTLLVTNTTKLVGIILGMIMDGMATGTSLNGWADGTLVIHSLLVVSVLVLGCYATWKWKRLAQYDDYHHPGNVKPFGFNSDLKHKSFSHNRGISDDLDWDVEMGNTVEMRSPGMMAPSTPGKPSPGRMDFSSSSSSSSSNGTHSRSGSAAALMSVETAYDPASTTSSVGPGPASYVTVTGTGSDRRVSYNHTRDTAFDEYVASQRSNKDNNKKQQQKKRRTSQRNSAGSDASHTSAASNTNSDSSSNENSTSSRHSLPGASQYRVSLGLSLKNDLDDALGAEFGWGRGPSRSSSADSDEMTMAAASGQPPAIIAVAGGAVAGAKNVRDSLGRAPSDGSERAAVGNVPEGEEDEEDEDEGDDSSSSSSSSSRRRRRQKNVDEASRALLGEEQASGPRQDGARITYPAALRPHRPISVVITPPPKSPTSEERGSRITWGSSYSRS